MSKSIISLLLLVAAIYVPVVTVHAQDPGIGQYLGLLEQMGLPPPSAVVAMGSPAEILSSSTIPGTDVQVTSDPKNRAQNEPGISINPDDSMNLVAGANDYRLVSVGPGRRITGDTWPGVYTSTDGGASWLNQLIPGFPGGPVSEISGFQAGGDPSVAFDHGNIVYYGGLVFNRPIRDGTIFVAGSNDGGLTFPQVRIVARGFATFIFNDKPYIAVDDSPTSPHAGNVYVSWTRFVALTRAEILVSRSSDGGVTWSAPVKVSVSPANQGSVPAVAPDGTLYVAYLDFADSTQKVVRSVDGGQTFGPPVVVDTVNHISSPLPNTRFRTNSFPSLVAVEDSNADGKPDLVVAWADDRFGNADVLAARSLDGGGTWTGAIKVNDDTTTNDQVFPWVGAAGGVVSVGFYDRRDDPANHDLHYYVAVSKDRGASFEPNVRISDVATNPDRGFGGGFIGDYTGGDCIAGAVAVRCTYVWTDTRNAIAGTATSSNQDIFADTVTID